MIRFNLLRLGVTIPTVLVFVVIANEIADNVDSQLFWPAFLALLLLFYLQGLVEISAEPPERGTLKFWARFLGTKNNGESGGIALPAGRWFLPWHGILFSLARYYAGERNFTVSVTERTPDSSEVLAQPFFTYHVDNNNSVRFHRSGDTSGVELKFGLRVDERVREWISSTDEGPQNLQEALPSNGLGMDTLIKTLLPGNLPEIPEDIVNSVPGGDDISTAMFIRYFTQRPPLPTTFGKDDPPLKERQVKARQALDALKTSDRPVWDALQKFARDRVVAVESIKLGNCDIRVENLGMIITLAGMGNIKPDGATKIAADKVALERQEAVADTIRSDTFQKQVEKFAQAHNNDMNAATEAIQLLRKLATKSIAEQQFALRADNAELLLKLLGPLGRAFVDHIAPSPKIHTQTTQSTKEK